MYNRISILTVLEGTYEECVCEGEDGDMANRHLKVLQILQR